MPSKKQKLIASMHKSAKVRNHKMTMCDFEIRGKKFWGEWSCINCGMTAYIETHPTPNSIEISGEAIALNCNGKEETINVKSEYFEVKKTVELDDSEKMAVENKEGLFFYHSYMRSQWELILIAHYMLLEFSDNCNYERTREFKDIETIQKQVDKAINSTNQLPEKFRLNCPITGKIEWYQFDSHELYEFEVDTMQRLSDYLTEVYGLDNYGCYYFEGDWGLWPYEDDSFDIYETWEKTA